MFFLVTAPSAIAPSSLLSPRVLRLFEPESERTVDLRSLNEMRGFSVHARDGYMGRVRDFVIDASSWFVRDVAIDIGSVLESRLVLVPSAKLEEIRWSENIVFFDGFRDELDGAPVLAPRDRTSGVEGSNHQNYS